MTSFRELFFDNPDKIFIPSHFARKGTETPLYMAKLACDYTFFRSNSEISKGISDSSGRIQKCANEIQIVQVEFRKF